MGFNTFSGLLKSGIKRLLLRRPWLFESALRLLRRSSHTEVMVLRKLIRRGDTVFDIGANIGQFSCLLSHLVGPEGSVHAFEPIPGVFHKLEINVKRAALHSNVFLNDCALSSSNGFVKMYVPGGDFTQSSMAKHSVASWTHDEAKPIINTYEKVNAVTLDSYMSQRGIQNVAFIKCDVEGAELLTLKGAESLLKGESPPILFLEVYDQWTKDFGYEPKELFEFLESEASYEFIHLSKSGLKRVGSWRQSIPGVFPDFLNFLCYVPTKHGHQIGPLLNIVS